MNASRKLIAKLAANAARNAGSLRVSAPSALFDYAEYDRTAKPATPRKPRTLTVGPIGGRRNR